MKLSEQNLQIVHLLEKIENNQSGQSKELNDKISNLLEDSKKKDLAIEILNKKYHDTISLLNLLELKNKYFEKDFGELSAGTKNKFIEIGEIIKKTKEKLFSVDEILKNHLVTDNVNNINTKVVKEDWKWIVVLLISIIITGLGFWKN